MGQKKPEFAVTEPLATVKHQDINSFLEDARTLFPGGRLMLRGDWPALQLGQEGRCTLVLPLLGEQLQADVKVERRLPEGMIFKVAKWEGDHQNRLWRFIALAWAFMRESKHPDFMGKMPPGAHGLELTDIINLSSPKRKGQAQSPEPVSPAPLRLIPPSPRSTPLKDPFLPSLSSTKAKKAAATTPSKLPGLTTTLSGEPGFYRYQPKAVVQASNLQAPTLAPKAAASFGPAPELSISSAPIEGGPLPRSRPEEPDWSSLGCYEDDPFHSPSPWTRPETPSPTPAKIRVDDAPWVDSLKEEEPLWSSEIKAEDLSWSSEVEADALSWSLDPEPDLPSPPPETPAAQSSPESPDAQVPPESSEQELDPWEAEAFNYKADLTPPQAEAASPNKAPATPEDTFTLRDEPLTTLLAEGIMAGVTQRIATRGHHQYREIDLVNGEVVALRERPRPDARLFKTAASAIGIPPETLKLGQHLGLSRDDPEAFMVREGYLTPLQGSRLLSRRLSIQLARAMEQGWHGEGRILPFDGTQRKQELSPSPALPLPRMIWDAMRSRAYTFTPGAIEDLERSINGARCRWTPKMLTFPMTDALTREEERTLYLLLRQQPEGQGFRLEINGKEQTIALWSLLRLGLLELS